MRDTITFKGESAEAALKILSGEPEAERSGAAQPCLPSANCCAEAGAEARVSSLISSPVAPKEAVRLETFDKIGRELDHAYGKHGCAQWGRHEFYAILKKEVNELWDAIKADDPQEDVRKEAIQVAAMVFRYLETGDKYREPALALQGERAIRRNAALSEAAGKETSK